MSPEKDEFTSLMLFTLSFFEQGENRNRTIAFEELSKGDDSMVRRIVYSINKHGVNDYYIYTIRGEHSFYSCKILPENHYFKIDEPPNFSEDLKLLERFMSASDIAHILEVKVDKMGLLTRRVLLGEKAMEVFKLFCGRYKDGDKAVELTSKEIYESLIHTRENEIDVSSDYDKNHRINTLIERYLIPKLDFTKLSFFVEPVKDMGGENLELLGGG